MKKFLSLLCSGLLMAASLSGCGKSSGTAKGKTTITIMQSKTEIQSSMQNVVNAYNSSHKNVTVKLLGTSGDNYSTVLQTQFSATPSKAPTIYSISGPGSDKFNKFMAPLDSSKAAKRIRSNFKNEVIVDGKICGIPMAVEGYGLIYNKDMFKKEGIDASSISSINSLVDASKKLKTVSNVTHPIAFAKDNYFIFIHPFNYALSVSKNYKSEIKSLDSGKKTMSDIPTVKQFADDLDAIKPYTNDAIDSYDDQVSGFANGKFAMIHQGDWVQSMLDQDKVSFDYGMMPFPTNGNKKLAVGLANAWRVNKYASSAQQKAAIDFLDWFLLSKKGQNYNADTFDFVSSLTGVKSPSTKLAKDVSSYVQNDETVPWVFNTDFPNGIDADGASLMQEYYAGKISSSQLLQKLTTVWVQDSQK